MASGIVCLYNDIHGNGFIEPSDRSSRLRFSNKDIVQSGFKILHEGQKVLFEIIENKNGKTAVEVTPVEE
jgi:cold shock CspA family protein